jgi:hypothetical protein
MAADTTDRTLADADQLADGQPAGGPLPCVGPGQAGSPPGWAAAAGHGGESASSEPPATTE